MSINHKNETFEQLLLWKREMKKLFNSSNEELNIDDYERENREKKIFEKLAELELQMIDVDKGMYFGTAYEIGGENVSREAIPMYADWKNLNNHVGTIGTTRVGKSVSMSGHIRQCIAKGWDCIVIDPKGGENQEILSSVTESCYSYDRMKDFLYYSPAFTEISQKLNILYGLTDIEISSLIMSSIQTPTMEDFYVQVGSRILLAIAASFSFLESFVDPTGELTKKLEEQELRNYYNYENENENKNDPFLQKDSIDILYENLETTKELQTLEEIGFNRTLITFGDLENYCHYNTLNSLRRVILSLTPKPHKDYDTSQINKKRKEALSLLNSALATDEAHFAKVSDTLSNRLIQLSIGPMGEILCGTRINPLLNRLTRKDKGVVAVVQPFPMKFKNSAEMFNKMLLGMIDSMMGTVGAEGRGLPRRVAIFIDEAGSIAYPGIENFFNRAGGLGVTVFVYTQSNEDYKEAVGENLANIIVDNVNTRHLMRQNLPQSCLAIAEEIGKFQVRKTMAMISPTGHDTSKYTTNIQEEYFCNPQDVRKLPIGEGIFMHNGKVYYLESPYSGPPKGAVEMPELKSEKSKRYLVDFEMKLENSINKEKEWEKAA